jgi:site-specific recombinase XerD
MNYVEQFLDFCQYQRSLSENTVNGYRWDLKIFMEWLKDKDLDVIMVKIRDIDSFIISLRKAGKSIQTVNRKIYALKMFYRYLQRIEVLDRNPLDFIKNIRRPKLLPKYLTEDQQKALLKVSVDGYKDHPNKWGSWLKDRDRLLILVLLDTGLRINEVCSMKKTDINLKEGILRIIGKGGKEREIILSDRCIEAIKGIPPNGSEEILFFNQWKKHLNSRHAFRIVKEIGRKAGIASLHPHLLRHTYASNLRRKGADLLLIKEALGHSSVTSTEIYAHIGGQEYKERLRALIN